ncbi:hypothetical protein SAMN05216267_1012134 [Actinacidiphila rubida]|uniref:Uncharacterized protein n=1 Tax=Actinacidiphila rubida TaxID=310780 RepID=A0A1H8KD07_9ACTN|nr:hypothetical protein SAMN05216267_1012134 [Actinacidiphila rubida]
MPARPAADIGVPPCRTCELAPGAGRAGGRGPTLTSAFAPAVTAPAAAAPAALVPGPAGRARPAGSDPATRGAGARSAPTLPGSFSELRGRLLSVIRVRVRRPSSVDTEVEARARTRVAGGIAALLGAREQGTQRLRHGPGHIRRSRRDAHLGDALLGKGEITCHGCPRPVAAPLIAHLLCPGQLRPVSTPSRATPGGGRRLPSPPGLGLRTRSRTRSRTRTGVPGDPTTHHPCIPRAPRDPAPGRPPSTGLGLLDFRSLPAEKRNYQWSSSWSGPVPGRRATRRPASPFIKNRARMTADVQETLDTTTLQLGPTARCSPLAFCVHDHSRAGGSGSRETIAKRS